MVESMPATVDQQYISLGDVTRNNKGQLRTLNKMLFPISYGDNFYEEVVSAGEYAKLGYYNDICVGAVCCRTEPKKENDEKKDADSKEETDNTKRVYMMTLGVLEPYRERGLGQKLLEHIIDHARTDQCSSIYLHVQTVNEQAVKFYEKNGFMIKTTVKGYYKAIEDCDAYILEKDLATSL